VSELKEPKLKVHRTLDNMVAVASATSGASRKFAAVYRRTAAKLNIQLAADCPDNDKAFTDETWGTILGIVFDSQLMAWRMPPHKVQELLEAAGTFITTSMVSLEEAQKLAGRVNHLSQMLLFLKAFRRLLNDLLGDFGGDENILLPVTDDLAADLKVITNATVTARDWLPIPEAATPPPSNAWHFMSDATGGLNSDEWAGVASVGLTESGKGIWFLARGIWPVAVYEVVDEKGARLASKMTMLETLGLLLPLLSVPALLAGQHVVLGVNNIGVVFGWQNGGCKGNRWASVLIRALHVVASYLGCTLHVTHVPRLSTAAAVMVDSLTRSSTATAEVWAQTAGAVTYGLLPVLWEWLADPSDDWHLGFKLVNSLKKKL
jgi:hypothetical protein